MDIDGDIIGVHKGYYKYTIGQRKGLNINCQGKSYVVEIKPETNEIIIGKNKELYASKLIARDFNWISNNVPNKPVRVEGRTRYHQKLSWAKAQVLDNGKVEVVFDEPQRAITKGQSVVLYDGDVVLGGGTIEKIDMDF